MAAIVLSVQSFLNSAVTLTVNIDDAQTVADLKNSINTAEGTPTVLMNLYLNNNLLSDATVLSAAGLITGSYVKSSNNLTETGLWTKQQRQDYKLQLAALRRAVTDRNSTYDINKLPNPYNGDDTNPDDGATDLELGRPWSAGGP